MKNILMLCLAVILLSSCTGTGQSTDTSNSRARDQAEINTSLGREYMNRGNFEIALEKLKKAVNADPSYAPGHTVLAVLYEQIREMELAEKHYRKAVLIAPENGDVNNNYGVFLCQSGRAADAAPYFVKAIDDPFYRTPAIAFANAGSCELQAGNLDKAESFLRQSLEYDAEFSDALLAMTRVSLSKGENFRARAFLQRYESTGAVSAQSLVLGYRIETGLNNAQNAEKYKDQLIFRFPDSEQAKEIRGESG